MPVNCVMDDLEPPEIMGYFKQSNVINELRKRCNCHIVTPSRIPQIIYSGHNWDVFLDLTLYGGKRFCETGTRVGRSFAPSAGPVG